MKSVVLPCPLKTAVVAFCYSLVNGPQVHKKVVFVLVKLWYVSAHSRMNTSIQNSWHLSATIY